LPSLTKPGDTLSLDPLMSAARASTLSRGHHGTTASPVPHEPVLDGSGLHAPAAVGTLDPLPWMDEVQRTTDAQLVRFFDARREQVRALLSRDGAVEAKSELLPAIEALTLRGGKRLRPAMLVASFRAISPDAIWTRTAAACAALELFQSYLLIHDDWMDGDLSRRGGPSVHAHLRERTGRDDLGDALAILAGDAASAMAWELFVEGALAAPGGTGSEAIAIFARIHQEVVLGQEMDLCGARDVARMQRLKTGSYTVTGPLEIGAVLAGASAEARAALRAFGEPLGEAFQVKDDLLGVFGDARSLGKPVGSDLRAGRRNALLRECERLLPAEERSALDAVLGNGAATDAQIEDIAQKLERTGIRARVEERLAGLLTRALDALEAGPFHDPGRTMLRELAQRLVHRDR
jgi:geranylgeranyl diphosphate synthase, type I